MDFHTPRYLIKKEIGYEKLKERWGLRALKFEEKIRKLEDKRLVKICWKKKKEAEEREIYSEEREQFLNERGWSSMGFELDRE